jgi:hypothetical protein
MGHWGFIAGLMLIVGFIFAIIIITCKESWLRKLFAIILAVIEVVVFGGAVFSLFLGLMTVIITISLFVIALVIFGSRVIARGST